MHGLTGALVGTTDTQTITGKTIDGDDNTLLNIPGASIAPGSIPDSALGPNINADKVNGVSIFVQSGTPTANAVGDIWVPIA